MWTETAQTLRGYLRKHQVALHERQPVSVNHRVNR
jgi:hypothetical protein